MALIDSYLIDIMPSVSGCPEQAATRAVIQAIREFCRETHALRYTQQITTVRNIAEYTLEPPTGCRLISVDRARFDGSKLSATSEAEMDRLVPGWDEESGTPTHYLLDGLATIVLYRKPEQMGIDALEVRQVLMVTDDATEIDDDFFDLYHDAVTAGAKARLLAIPKKPWANLALSGTFRDQFEQEMATARVRAEKGNVKRSLRVSPVRFG
ncbi:MAG: hypothetical protein PVI97_13975 [Candidatus Thiodiazotropha sp.]|jgi:hypothetical protein